MLRIRSAWLAWSFDEAVHLFGVRTDNRLEETVVVDPRTGKRQRKYTLEQALGIEPDVKPVSKETFLMMFGGVSKRVGG